MEDRWTLDDSSHPLPYLTHFVNRETGDGGENSESWVHYSVLTEIADNVSGWEMVLSTHWDQTPHGSVIA